MSDVDGIRISGPCPRDHGSVNPTFSRSLNRPPENFAKSTGSREGHCSQIHFAAKHMGHRRDSLVRYPTGHDHLEILEVGVYVERKSVAGNPAGNPDSNCGDLLVSNPHSRQAWDPCAGDIKISKRTDQDIFKVAHITVHITPVRFQIDYRIADQLTRSMIGNIAAAPGLMNFN